MEAATAERVEPAPEAPPPRSGIPAPGEPLPPAARYGGKEVILSDGRAWIIPSFSLGQVHGPALQLFSGLLRVMVMLNDNQASEILVVKKLTADVTELVKMALDRNYPTLRLTFEDVGDLLTLENTPAVLRIIYDLNRFVTETLRLLGIAPPQQTTPTEAPGTTG